MNRKNRIVPLLTAALLTLTGTVLAEERLFYDVITNANGLGLSPSVVCAPKAYGSYTHVFDGVTDNYGEHRYMPTKAKQMFFDLAPSWTNHTHFLETIANKRMAPRRYRLARMTAYEDAGTGTANALNRAPCEWYLYGLTRSQTLSHNPESAWKGTVATRYTNGVQSVLLDHRKDFFWPKNTMRPGFGNATYPYLKDCHWAEFAIDEKFADFDFVGFRLYCVDSTSLRKNETITFGIGQFEVYVDYEDFSANESDFEVRSDVAADPAGFSPALNAKPVPGTVCTAPASYVDAAGNTWYRQGWTIQSRIMGWRDTERGWTDSYTIPERDGYLHRLVWNYERRSPRKATKLISTDQKAVLELARSWSEKGTYNNKLYNLFNGVISGEGARALGYIRQGCSVTLTLTGEALLSHRLVPIGYRVVESDIDNSNTTSPGRSPTAWRLYGVRANGAKVLIGEERERQSICPMFDQDVGTSADMKLPSGATGLSGTIYPLTASEDVCREGFTGYVFEPLSSIYYEQGQTGIDFSLNEVEIFVETNGLSEITVASDLAGTGFTPELGTVVTDAATLAPPDSLVWDGFTYKPNGYRRYTLRNGAWELVETGKENTYAYNPSDNAVSRLVWQWRKVEDAVSLWQHVKETSGAAVAIVSGGTQYSGYVANRAFDGDTSSAESNRWLANLYCGNISLGIAVTGLESERLVPQSYTLYRTQLSFASDAQRAPSAWVLYGIPAGCENVTNRWVELDRRSGVYWSDNSWQEIESNPLRAISRTYPVTAPADAVSAGFASYRLVPLRSFLYDLGLGYDRTIATPSNINFGLAELELNVSPCGKDALLIASAVGQGLDGTAFDPPIGTAFRTAFEGTRTCTAPATLEVDGTLYATAGYAIEKLNEQTGEWIEESAGEGTTCACTWQTDGAVRRLVWKWSVTGVRVNADPENGTELVTYSSGNALTYRTPGESVTVTAQGNTTAPLSTFEYWAGDVEGVENISNATITVTADRAKRLKPKFLRNWRAWWNNSLSMTFLTDGNWIFRANVSEDKIHYTLGKCESGSGDLDFRGKIFASGGERWVTDLWATYTTAPITSIVFPETLEILHADFWQCYSLTNVVFDSPALTNIGRRAFARCKGIRRVTFGPQTRSDLDFVDKPFLCEYPNQHPDEYVFQCGALPEEELRELVKIQNEALVEGSVVFRVDRDKPGWRSLSAKRSPTTWEKYYTSEQDRKNFKSVFSTVWRSTEKNAKILYIDRGSTGLMIIVK